MSIPPLLTPSLTPFLLFLPLLCIAPCCKASALGGLSPSLFPSSQIPGARLRAATAALSMLRSPSLRLELLRDLPGRRASAFIYRFRLLVLVCILLQTYCTS